MLGLLRLIFMARYFYEFSALICSVSDLTRVLLMTNHLILAQGLVLSELP